MILKDGELQKTPEGVPVNRMMIMPRDEIELLDTWQAQGLKRHRLGRFPREQGAGSESAFCFTHPGYAG